MFYLSSLCFIFQLSTTLTNGVTPNIYILERSALRLAQNLPDVLFVKFMFHFSVVIDSNQWYHATYIIPGEISITIGSEFA